MIERMKDYDFTLIITPILLAAFGIVMIYSASMVAAVVEGLGSTYYLFKQLQWFIIGLIGLDRKSTRLNSSHVAISYAVFCLKKKNHIVITIFMLYVYSF